MTIELIRVTCDLYERGAVISAPTTKWLTSFDRFHSRRTVFPVLPVEQWLKTYEDGISMALQDFIHLRLVAVGPSCPISTVDGAMDFLMVDTRLDWLLGDNLPRMATRAVMTAPPFQNRRSFCVWLELWDVEGRKGIANFVTDQVDLTKLARNL